MTGCCAVTFLVIFACIVALGVKGCQTSTQSTPMIGETVCAHASREFQTVLQDTLQRDVLRISCASNGSAPGGALSTSWTPLRAALVNPAIGSNVSMHGCSDVGESFASLLDNTTTVCCGKEHILNRTARSRILWITQLVLLRLESFVMVDFVGGGPLAFTNQSMVVCPLPYNYRLISFSDAATNFGVIVTSVPYRGIVGDRTLSWALPCAFDNRGRPLLVQLNVNPAFLTSGNISDAQWMQEVQHQLFHAFGFGMWKLAKLWPSTAPGYALRGGWSSTNATQLQKQVVSWEDPNAWNGVPNACPSDGVPFDDELRLQTQTGVPPAYPSVFDASTTLEWASHWEPRVVVDDFMTSDEGRFSWELSRFTVNFFANKLASIGLMLREEPALCAVNVSHYVDDMRFADYLAVATANSTATPLNNTAMPALTIPPSILEYSLGGSGFHDCTSLWTPCDALTSVDQIPRYCFPSSEASTPPTGGCSADRLEQLSCAGALILGGSNGSTIPSAYRYQNPQMAIAGVSPAADYCPMRNRAVASTGEPCSVVRNDIPARGNNYSADSRCFWSNTTAVGPRPASVGATRCFRSRCPYGVRVELQLNQSTVWIPCDAAGNESVIPNVTLYDSRFTGSIRCPSAEELCGAVNPLASSNGDSSTSSPPWVPSVDASAAFTTATGYAISFYVTQAEGAFSWNQGRRVCSQFANGSSIGFVPDSSFGKIVAAAASPAAPLLWIGAMYALTPSWVSFNQRYSVSRVTLPLPSTPLNNTLCYALNLTATALDMPGSRGSVVVVLPCRTLLPVLCTRATPIPDASFPLCPPSRRCSPTSVVTNFTLHRQYFVPLSNDLRSGLGDRLLGTRAESWNRCNVAASPPASLFDLNNLTSIGPPLSYPSSVAPWYQTLHSVLSTLQIGSVSDITGVWTSLTWVNSSESQPPPWLILVQNWDYATSVDPAPNATFCFLLVTPGPSFQPLFATQNCDGRFPSVCYYQNSITPVPLPGYNFDLYLNRVPVTYGTVTDPNFCASGVTNGFFPVSPDGRMFRYMVDWYQTLIQSTAASPIDMLAVPLFLGVSVVWNGINETTLVYPFATSTVANLQTNATSLSFPARAQLVAVTSRTMPPSGTYAAALNTSGELILIPASADTVGLYACAAGRAPPPLPASWTGPCGDAALPCDVLVNLSDSLFFVPYALQSHDEGWATCQRQDALPSFSAAASRERGSFMTNLTVTALNDGYRSQLGSNLFWTGLMVNGSGDVSLGNSSNSALGATFLDVVLSSLSFFFAEDQSQLTPGACLAAFLTVDRATTVINPSAKLPMVNRTMAVLRPVDCATRLLFPCRQPLTTSPPLFVPWSSTSTPTVPTILPVMPYFSFAVVSQAASFARASRVCQGQLGALSWYPNTVDATNPLQVSQAVGNIADHPSMPTGVAKLWTGFGSAVTSTSRTVYQPFGLPNNASVVVGEPISTSRCFALSTLLTLTQEVNCNQNFSFICMRPIANLTVQLPTTTAGVLVSNVSYSATTRVPLMSFSFVGAGSTVQLAFTANRSSTRSELLSIDNIPTVTPNAVAAQTVSSVFTFACGVQPFAPTSIALIGVQQRACCGIRSYTIPLVSLPPIVATLFPCYTMEIATSALGPFFTAPREAIVVNDVNRSVFFRMPSVPSLASISVVVTLRAAVSRGSTVAPSVIAGAALTTTVNFVRNVTNLSAIDSYTSRVVPFDLQPTGLGGILELYWNIASCNASDLCSTGMAPTALAVIVAQARAPILSSSLSPSIVPVESSALLLVRLPTPLLQTMTSGVVLSSNCTSVRFSPPAAQFNTSSLGLAVFELIASGTIHEFCSVDAQTTTIAAAEDADPSVQWILPETTFTALRVVEITDRIALEATLYPPYLDLFPGESAVITVSRRSLGGQSLQGLALQIQLQTNESVLARVLQLPAPPIGQSWPVATLATPLADPTASSAAVTFRLTVTTSQSLLLAAMNQSGVSPPGASVNQTVSAFVACRFFDVTAGINAAVALATLLPPLRVSLRQALHVRSTPSILLTGSTSVDPVEVWLAQAPIGAVNVSVTCTLNSSFPSFSASVTFLPTEMAADHVVGVSKFVALSAPDSLTDNLQLPFNSTWTCAFAVAATPDVVPYAAAFPVMVIKRGRASIDAQSIPIMRPNRTYQLNVTIQSSRYSGRSVAVLPALIPSNGTFIAFQQLYQVVSPNNAAAPETLITTCVCQVTIPAWAYGGSPQVILTVLLNDTAWFRSPPPVTFVFAPLVTAYGVDPPPTFTRTQALGVKNAQSLELMLSVLPREGPITAACATSPLVDGSGAPLATITPSLITWPVSISGGNASTSRSSITIIGNVSDVLFRLVCVISSSGSELSAFPPSKTTIFLIGGQVMQFIPLIRVALSVVNFNGILFVGWDTSKIALVSISTLPERDLIVTLAASPNGVLNPFLDPASCLSITPSAVTFFANGTADTTQVVNVTGECDSSVLAVVDPASTIRMNTFANITLAGVISTTATNVDTSPEAQLRLTASFPILPKRQVYLVDPTTNQVVSGIVLYCGGSPTSLAALVNVSALPVDPTDTALVSLQWISLPRSVPAASAPYVTPATLQFSKALSATLTSRVWTFTCPTDYFDGATANTETTTALLAVQASAEFAHPGPTIQVTLSRLLGASVTIPPLITVGSATVSMIVSPEALPQAGQVLVLDFVSSCPSSIHLQHGNAMTWYSTMDDAQQALRIITTAPATDCLVAVQLSATSVARNYYPTLFQSVVQIVPPSSVGWYSGSGAPTWNVPTVPSAEIAAAQHLGGSHTLQIHVNSQNEFVADRLIPTPLFDVTYFKNGTDFALYTAALALTANSTTSSASPVYIYSNVPGSRESGLMSVIRQNPLAVSLTRASENNPSVLNLTITSAGTVYDPPEDELITFVFTPFALTRSDAPLDPSGTNVSVYVSATPNELSNQRAATFASAYLMAAALSPFSGPSLATRATHMASILDIVPCPSVNWRTQKQLGMSAIVDPIPVGIGDASDLSRYFGGAVYALLLFLAFVVLHCVAMFLVYARRLELQSKVDATAGVALATLRFPSLELFPAMYVCGVICHFSLKVMVYSNTSSMRGVSALLFAVAGCGVPACMVSLLSRASPAVFEEGVVPTSCVEAIFFSQGRWTTDPKVLTIANEAIRSSFLRYLRKFGMLFEDFVGPLSTMQVAATVSALTAKKHRLHRASVMTAASEMDMNRVTTSVTHTVSAHHHGEGANETTAEDDISGLALFRARFSRWYYFFDLLATVAIAATTVYEPVTKQGCLVQAWILFTLTLTPALVLAVVRPYRYHCQTMIMFTLALAEALAVSAKIIGLMSDAADANFVSQMVNGCLIAVGGLMFVKIITDLCYGVVALAEHATKNGYSGAAGQLITKLVDAEDFRSDRLIEVDHDVPMQELLQDFVSHDIIEMCERSAESAAGSGGGRDSGGASSDVTSNLSATSRRNSTLVRPVVQRESGGFVLGRAASVSPRGARANSEALL